jgi:hypothetical protein
MEIACCELKGVFQKDAIMNETGKGMNIERIVRG